MFLPTLNTHLTYCTNVHPGETLDAALAMLAGPVLEVKRQVSPNAPFGVGLRLAAEAAEELERAGALEHLASTLESSGLYVFTLNGFPYGAFHGTRVKERVYSPDWLEPARLGYTERLARVLERLLPSGVRGSISTVPGCFGESARSDTAREQIARNLARAAHGLLRIERESGKLIELALEPEPACLLETSAQAVEFFQEYLFSSASVAFLAAEAGLSPSAAEAALRRHLGVCLDTCHCAVEFEPALDALSALRRAGISVGKIQVSAGLKLLPANAERKRALAAFNNDVYLHQTVIREGEARSHFLDLPDALASSASEASEWRVHFHVPVFQRELGLFESTQAELAPLLAALGGGEPCPPLEVETYTWDVLPERFRDVPLTTAIARELEWTRSALGLSRHASNEAAR